MDRDFGEGPRRVCRLSFLYFLPAGSVVAVWQLTDLADLHGPMTSDVPSKPAALKYCAGLYREYRVSSIYSIYLLRIS